MSLFDISLLIVLVLVVCPILIWIGRGLVPLFRRIGASALRRRQQSKGR